MRWQFSAPRAGSAPGRTRRTTESGGRWALVTLMRNGEDLTNRSVTNAGGRCSTPSIRTARFASCWGDSIRRDGHLALRIRPCRRSASTTFRTWTGGPGHTCPASSPSAATLCGSQSSRRIRHAGTRPSSVLLRLTAPGCSCFAARAGSVASLGVELDGAPARAASADSAVRCRRRARAGACQPGVGGAIEEEHRGGRHSATSCRRAAPPAAS